MTNFWYEPTMAKSATSQPLWQDDFPNTELPIPHLPLKMAGRHRPERRHAERRSWNNDSLLHPTQSMLMQHHSSSMSLEGSAYADPGLSSHNTSRRSSTNPPLTPNNGGSISTPTRTSFMAPHVFDRIEYQQPFDFEVAVDQSLVGIPLSDPTYPHHVLKYPIPDPAWLNTIQEQPWEGSFPTAPQYSSQQATTLRPHWSASPSQHTHAMDETWPMDKLATWSFGDDRVLPIKAGDAADYEANLPTSFNSQEGGRDTAFVAPEETASHVRIEYPSVQCEHCGNIYTGKYGTGNMHRHVRLKHAHEHQREYICLICERVYNRSDALRNHERSKHPKLQHASVASRSAS